MKRPHPLHLLAASLAWNYIRHRRHGSTICSHTREHIPPIVANAAWLGFNAWLIPHWNQWWKR